MTSAHHHHTKYSLHPPPQSSQNDFRLPSLKDLNFQYRSPQNGAPGPPQQSPILEPPPQQQEPSSAPRHIPTWSRSTQNLPSSSAHQQHTPPLSAGVHELAQSKVEYPSKHENGGYVHPGLPLSAQVIPSSMNAGVSRNGDPAPHSPVQTKRPRATPSNMAQSRDVRAPHVNCLCFFFCCRH